MPWPASPWTGRTRGLCLAAWTGLSRCGALQHWSASTLWNEGLMRAILGWSGRSFYTMWRFHNKSLGYWSDWSKSISTSLYHKQPFHYTVSERSTNTWFTSLYCFTCILLIIASLYYQTKLIMLEISYSVGHNARNDSNAEVMSVTAYERQCSSDVNKHTCKLTNSILNIALHHSVTHYICVGKASAAVKRDLRLATCSKWLTLQLCCDSLSKMSC